MESAYTELISQLNEIEAAGNATNENLRTVIKGQNTIISQLCTTQKHLVDLAQIMALSLTGETKLKLQRLLKTMVI